MEQEQVMDFDKFMERLTDGTQTTLIPFFMTTPRNKFIKEVIHRVKQETKRSEPSRIFLLFQEGISYRKVRKIWRELCDKGNKAIDNPQSDKISLEIVRGVPIEVLMKFIDGMQGKTEFV